VIGARPADATRRRRWRSTGVCEGDRRPPRPRTVSRLTSRRLPVEGADRRARGSECRARRAHGYDSLRLRAKPSRPRGRARLRQADVTAVSWGARTGALARAAPAYWATGWSPSSTFPRQGRPGRAAASGPARTRPAGGERSCGYQRAACRVVAPASSSTSPAVLAHGSASSWRARLRSARSDKSAKGRTSCCRSARGRSAAADQGPRGLERLADALQWATAPPCRGPLVEAGWGLRGSAKGRPVGQEPCPAASTLRARGSPARGAAPSGGCRDRRRSLAVNSDPRGADLRRRRTYGAVADLFEVARRGSNGSCRLTWTSASQTTSPRSAKAVRAAPWCADFPRRVTWRALEPERISERFRRRR